MFCRSGVLVKMDPDHRTNPVQCYVSQSSLQAHCSTTLFGVLFKGQLTAVKSSGTERAASYVPATPNDL